MKRQELLDKMIKCFDTCTLDMQYDVNTAMDRVLEVVEEELNIKFGNGNGGVNSDPDDTDYCGAI